MNIPVDGDCSSDDPSRILIFCCIPSGSSDMLIAAWENDEMATTNSSFCEDASEGFHIIFSLEKTGAESINL
jgi:hypothetical protein